MLSNSKEQYQNWKWLLEFGASEHMCCVNALFYLYQQIRILVCGRITVKVNNGNKRFDTTIDTVLFAPTQRTNLSSVSPVSDRRYIMMTVRVHIIQIKSLVRWQIEEGAPMHVFFCFKYEVARVEETL